MTAPVIVGAVRTPLGAVHGALAEMHPTELLGVVLNALADRAGFEGRDVYEVVCGCVEQVGGQGGNVARGALLAAGWSASIGGTTVDRDATSGTAALAAAHALVAAGAAPLVVAAAVGMPSVVPAGAAAMGRHPYGRPWGSLSKARALVPPPVAAERLGVSRADQDAWAGHTHDMARFAVDAGTFRDELVDAGPLTADELPPRAVNREGLAALPPAFDPEGTVTSGNLAPLADGAAAIAVADPTWAANHGLRPLASIASVQLRAGEPDDLVGAATRAGRAVCDGAVKPVHSIELPESTAAITVALVRALEVDPSLVNPTGGALALGDPPGASDLRALVTLVHRLARDEAATGLAVAAGLGLGAATLLSRAP